MKNMDYLELHPFKQISDTDGVTKKKYADMVGKALLGIDINSDYFKDLDKQSKKYSGIGHKRKLELCHDLKLAAGVLTRIMNKFKSVKDKNNKKLDYINRKDDILKREKELGAKKNDLLRDIENLANENNSYNVVNSAVKDQIKSLEALLKVEVEGSTDNLHLKLKNIFQDFKLKTCLIENEIGALENRKEEIINMLMWSDRDTTRESTEALRIKKMKLEDKLTKKQKIYFELKDKIDSNNAKISVQVRRSKEELENKWKTDVEFIRRRIEEREKSNRVLDERITELEEDIVAKGCRLEELEAQLREYEENPPTGPQSDDNRKSKNKLKLKQKKCDQFINFLCERFVEMKEELESLWGMSGRNEYKDTLVKKLNEFMKWINEVNNNLEGFTNTK